ncbi:MAG TPA: aminotransferase class I/II-fold pyridoxal phosphate-dependent enzyme, partial [Chloroflexia bacterium]|nr:aminotransferase class I/II-fold pyridoxal phosphate-dependent enzyme [Chloroflexia bacterium]
GDEVIYISPPWFFYEALILTYGARPVRVKIDPATFDLDLDAIAAAITERTRAIIVNSPNNPTGKIYPPETLSRLGALLTEASKRNGRRIYLLSDEAYSRIVFDGREYPSPTAFYPDSFLLYTYGKTLLTPGQRLGYIALPPTMTGREVLRNAIFAAQAMTGFAFPNALLQHAIGDLEKLSIDVGHLQQKRDRMVGALRDMGYSLHVPEGTFYLLVRSPIEDDWAFTTMLAERDVLCLPGTVVEEPGYFRISLTAGDEMIERSLPHFAAAMSEAGVMMRDA